ncbi:DUF1707 domain-containing protein [Amycolatopsis umgeniensis]|uniref:DUF1707 domain-containing protein n=1 Tax=Amycolatopsis umgeniensis TaxID=336628 RepID=A0A841ARM1_9PSEU|nr:DUF1707 domain-containing protein [Amycolatopsis umgeniensis]MBB5850546.1 hypothetical protein [Amycolatopsis umgeniensis]
MSEVERSARRVADSDREKVAQLLYEAMGAGRITTAELETRLDAVYSAKTFADFEPVIADLSPMSTGPEDARGGRSSIAVMSGTRRRFDGMLPSKHVSRALWGSVRLDLRYAEIAADPCTIRAVAIMGGVKIVVPEDFVVDVRGVGLMGGFGTGRGRAPRRAAVGAPVLRVTGFAWWGSVKVIRKAREPLTRGRRR